MQFKIDIPTATARLNALPEVLPSDPQDIFEHADASLYVPQQDGSYAIDSGKRDDLIRSLQSLALKAENDDLREQQNRQTVVDELRRGLRAAGVNPALVNAAAALHMTTHRFGIDENGKVRVMDQRGTVADCLQSAIRWIEQDEHAGFKRGDRHNSDDGEFSRLVESLRH